MSPVIRCFPRVLHPPTMKPQWYMQAAFILKIEVLENNNYKQTTPYGDYRMADTLPSIDLTSTDWINLNTASGIAVGTSINVQNQSSTALLLATSPTKPNLDFKGVVVPPLPAQIATIGAGESAVWALGGGAVNVQEAYSKSTVATATVVQEFGVVESPAGAWDEKALILGGLKFYWSGVDGKVGSLAIIKATGSDAPSNVPASQMVCVQRGSTSFWQSDINNNVWPTTAILFWSVPQITTSQKVEFDICTRGRGETTAVWKITAQSNRSTTLVLSGTYIGPRYITGT
jgi:hypothetical protein